MSPASTRRFRVRRAIERGDPRLGLVVGVLIAALAALAFVRRDWVGVAETLELKALDVAFKNRPAIQESDKIVLVNIDSLTVRKLDWPMQRSWYAKATLALDRLGASQIVFDVEFKMILPERGRYDEETGDYRLSPEEVLLRQAIAKSGKVTLAYHFDLADPLPARLRPHLEGLKRAFGGNIRADAVEAARAVGVPAEWFQNELESIREHLLVSIVDDEMAARPGLSFSDLKAKYLPGYDGRVDGSYLNVLQFAWQMARATREVTSKTTILKDRTVSGGHRKAYGIVPPLMPFLEVAARAGAANAESDAQDGVMRRPWSHLSFQGKEYAYLGLESGLEALAGPGTASVAEIVDDRLDLAWSSGSAEPRRVELPVEREGRLLVNWAGNDRRNRRASSSYFSNLPFLKLIEFYKTRYEDLDGIVRKTLVQLTGDERDLLKADEYYKLSDRLREVLEGKVELPPERLRQIEDRMDALRQSMMAQFQEFIAVNEKALAALSNPPKRVREDAEKKLAKWRTQVEAISGPYDMEAKLRPLIRGKLCLIGSADTASGDLHSTPLGPATPGMDVLANVANMALTGQSIRRVPAWVNFTYLFAIGLLVSFYVTHGSATWSSVATVVTVVVTGGLFWVLFTGPSILIAAAGPVVTAILTFGGVTTYKELLTQRSKRKLQRELEKNTSPELVKIILERPEVLSEPRRLTGTFLFSDVKSFTSISEKMHADVLFPFINRYLDRQTQALKAHQAFVDKYIGDGIMALFGIPVPTPDHAKNACLAALDCQAALKPLNAEFKLEGLPQIKARIGVHSGEVSAGNVGALDRSNYTVLGDNVNLAARLEGANKEYDTSVMISEATWMLVQGKFVVRELDRIRVVGKKNAVRIYELIAPAGGHLTMDPAFLDVYARALEAFKGRRWPEAMQGFQNAMELKPGDVPSKNYIERAKVFQIMPPPADWEGVFDLTSK
ncbi:MAG TPA: CHASE2 domain-containing protein [Planctomycetota bacterium]|nr:CHASE2 domain-containing protein [Planctomycetota bacterium]